MPEIRLSTPADGPRVVDIWRSAVDATHDFLSRDDRVAIEREVEGFLPQLPLWLALDAAGRPVGFMALANGHIDALFIDAAARGTGIGRALVDHALTLAPTLTTDVNEQNPQALGFYERLGFETVGRSDRDGAGRPYPLLHLRRPPDRR